MTSDKPTVSPVDSASANNAALAPQTKPAKAAPKKTTATKAAGAKQADTKSTAEAKPKIEQKPVASKKPASASNETKAKPADEKAVSAKPIKTPDSTAKTENIKTSAAKPTAKKAAAVKAKPTSNSATAQPAITAVAEAQQTSEVAAPTNSILAPAPKKSAPKTRLRKPLSPAIQGIWQRVPHFMQLMRLDKPIGILLLLWPTLWALWLAAKGFPSIKNLAIFSLGVLVMRSAGCVINDFADRKIDGKVQRTQGRPLATGVISSREAIILFVTLCLIAFGLVLLTDPLTIKLSVGGLLLAFSYPFMKRHTHLPQVVLGAAFAWGIPMAYAAETGALDKNMWLIYLAVVLWTVVYDTFYAMVDRDDDLKIGVKSTAILFGEQDRVITGALQIMVVYALVLVGKAYSLGWVFYVGLAVAAGLFAYQQWLIRFRERHACFKAFLNNNWVGAAIFAGIAADFALK